MKYNLTATEIAARQKALEQEWHSKLEKEYEKIAKEVWDEMYKAQQAYEDISRKHQRLTQLIEELMEANPQYTKYTRAIAEVILSKYPKLGKLTDNMDIMIPFVYSVAYELEKHLETIVPEELQCQ